MKRLSVALLTAVACGGNGSTKVPAAPGNVGVTPGDQSAFVTWDAVADATDYFVYYNTADAVLDKSSPRVATNVPSATVGGLRNGVAMEFAVSAHNSAGESDLSPVVGGTPHAGSPLVVTALDPADSAAGVSRNATLSVTFNRAVAANTVTTSGTSACGSSTVQLSSDDFATCVPLGTPHTTVDLTFTVSTLSPLSASTAYKLRVTTGVQESSGEALHAAAVSAFTTEAALAVVSISPADGSTNVDDLTSITITFNRAARASTATGNVGSDATCSGALQMSVDNFATCFRQDSDPAESDDHLSWTLIPFDNWPPGAVVKVRVTSDLLDTEGLPATPSTSAGFTIADIPLTANIDASTSLKTHIAVNFSRAFDPATLSATADCLGTVQLKPSAGGSCVPLIADVDNAHLNVAFSSASFLTPATQYTLTLTTGINDGAGHALQSNATKTFTTEPAFSVQLAPASGTQALDVAVTATFDRAPANVSAACGGNLFVTNGGACVAASGTLNGNVVTLHPDAGVWPAGATLVVHAAAALADSDGVSLGAEQIASFSTEPYLTVLSSIPADGAVDPVARNTPIQITFNRAPDTSTLTTSTGTDCSKAIDLSSDPSFADCVPMTKATADAVDGDPLSFRVQPAQPLQGGARYYLRVRTSVTDPDGVAMSPQFDTASGFTVKDALAVTGTLPANGATNLARNLAQVTIELNAPVKAASVTINSDGACNGSVQLSDDGFNTCLPLGSLDLSTPRSISAAPAALLGGGKTYVFKVSVEDADGVPMDAVYLSPSGFTVKPALVATLTPTGNSVSQAASAVAAFSSQPLHVVGPAAGDCTNATFYLLDGAGGCVPASLGADETGQFFTLKPDAFLTADAGYSIVLKSSITDADGAPLSNPQTASFHTEPAFAVSSIEPAEGATDVARNSAVLIHFNRAVGNTALTTNTTDTTCSGTFQVYAQGSSSCVQMAQAPQLVAADTVKLQPNLAADTQYFVRVLQAFSDSDGVPMAADFVSTTGFHTKPAVTVSVTPADGSSGVSVDTGIDLLFSRAVDASTVTAAGSSCSGGTVLVSIDSFAHCFPVASVDPATGNATAVHFTLAQELPEGALVRVKILPSVSDADGIPLGTTVTTAGFTTSMPDVADAALSVANLQSLSFTWTTDGSEDHTNLYVSSAGANSFSLAGTGDGSGGTASGLTPLQSYDVRITTVSAAGVESAGVTLTGISTAFTGTEADWLSGQTVAGMNGDLYRLTWSSTSLFAGVSNSDGDSLLNDGDALWIAVDTHVDSSNHGQLRTNTAHTNGGVIWPFRIDYIVQLQQLGAASTAVSIYQATQGTFTALTGYAQYEGAVDEVQVPLSAIGSPSKARFALLAINPSSGYVFSVAPKNPGATDVTAYFASLTSGFDSGTNAFLPSTAAHSLDASVSPTLEYPNLVTMSVLKTGATGPVMIRGSAQPLSYSLGDSVYELKDDGTQGDATAGDGVYTGRFNFAASTGLLFFQFDDNGTTEFSSGKDRIRSLSGSAEVVPQVSFNTVWSASNSFTIDFVCNTGGTPAQIAVFRPFTDTITPVTNLGGTFYEATKTYSNQDFINGTAFAFKMQYSDGHFEDNGDHTVDDDIIGYARLQWSAGDSTTY